MTTTTPSPVRRGHREAADRRSRRSRGLYVFAVASFPCALAPTLVEAVAEDATGGSRAAVAVLAALGLGLVGAVCGVVGSLMLDVVLLLAVRVSGTDAGFSRTSRLVDAALPPLAAGVAAAAALTLAWGPERAFASPVPTVVMGAAVLAHLLVLYRRLPAHGVAGQRHRAVALALYVAVPGTLIALAGSGS
jgi:hypothetical protein